MVRSEEVMRAFEAAGIIEGSDQIRRAVLDLRAGYEAVLHIERFVDAAILEVISLGLGVEVREKLQT